MAFSQDSAIGPESTASGISRPASIGVKPEGDLLKQLELLDRAKGVPADERVDIGKEICSSRSTTSGSSARSASRRPCWASSSRSNNMGNVPDCVVGSTPGQTPGNARPTQFFFKS